MSTAIVDTPDVGWSSIDLFNALQLRAIARGDARRGIDLESAVLPIEHLADIVWLDQSAGGEPAQHADV